MSDTYDIIICGAGSGGGYLAGEVAPHSSVLILDAGPRVVGEPNPGFGSPETRIAATQINLGTFIPDGVHSKARGKLSFAYPIAMNAANPAAYSIQREARVVGGGSLINVGAWLRPRHVDWDGFAEETGVDGWTKEAFEPHFQKAEQILHVHRDARANWNPASLLYEQAARAMGIPVFETASNRHNCIFCGHRLNAGMPCKYDALMSTAVTQIPKALQHGTTLIDDASVVKVDITDGKATGVTYRKDGELKSAKAEKLVVLSAGAVGTPLILYNSGVNNLNRNVGRFLRAHPVVIMEAVIPGNDWNSDRGYQWNLHHFVMDSNGEPLDTLVHASAAFPTTPWIAAQVGAFGRPYKDFMRAFRQRVGVIIFGLKPAVTGRVFGSVEAPLIKYPIADTSGLLEPKSLSEFAAAVRQVGQVFSRMGAIGAFPSPILPTNFLHEFITSIATGGSAFHPQGTCRAGIDPQNSVVDSNCMSHDIENLMCCDASVIPNHISSNPNAMIMAVAGRCAEFITDNILGS